MRAPAVGVSYLDRGYRYGNRYWRERYRWHGGGRYRLAITLRVPAMRAAT